MSMTGSSRRAALVVAGNLDGVTGGNVYDRSLIARLQERGWAVDIVEPGGSLAGYDVVLLDSLAFPSGAPNTEAPVVALAHQLPSAAGASQDVRTAERGALAACRLVIAVSAHVASSIRRLVDRSVVVLPPGRDGAAWTGAPNPQREVLVVGNALPGKGLPDAIQAFAMARLPGARLVIAGDLHRDRQEGAVVAQVAAEAEGSVELAGIFSPDALAERYGRARVLLTASRYEGWPIAVGEAMASGVPVVGYDIPGHREMIRSGGEGILTPPGDVPALADSLRRVWRDGDLAVRLGQAGRRKAMQWPTWAETVSRATLLIERAAMGVAADHLTEAR
jgi:glycosyltransferase involved in cell wall biosynthesis